MTEISNILNPSVRVNFKRDGRTISVWSHHYKNPAELEAKTKQVFMLVEDFVQSGKYFYSVLAYAEPQLQELTSEIWGVLGEIEELDTALRHCHDYVARQHAEERQSQLTGRYRELKESYNKLKRDRYLIQQKTLSEETPETALATIELKMKVLQGAMNSVQKRLTHVFDNVVPMTDRTITMKKNRSALVKQLTKLIQDEWYNSHLKKLLQRLLNYYEIDGEIIGDSWFSASYDRHEDVDSNTTAVFGSNITLQGYLNAKDMRLEISDEAVRVLVSTLVDKALLDHKIIRVHSVV